MLSALRAIKAGTDQSTIRFQGSDMEKLLTHLREDGSPHMVDIGAKKYTKRIAQAEGRVFLSQKTIEEIRKGVKKGDVLSIAQLAGICGAKRTADIIPLCHPIPIDSVQVDVELQEKGVYIWSEVQNEWKTGVEMEAITAVMTAALCVYDMVKSLQKDATIGDIRLIYKEGGKSGVFGKAKKREEF